MDLYRKLWLTFGRSAYYLDGSGDVGLIRRALQVDIESPTLLRNIAIWDYWQDADWAVSIGTGGTRIQVLSLGWVGFGSIAISPTRTSVGLVVPAEYYKACGKSTDELYRQAIAKNPGRSSAQQGERENILQAQETGASSRNESQARTGFS